MELLNILSFSVSIVGVIIIFWGVIITIVEFLYSEYKFLIKDKRVVFEKKARSLLGSYILLGLEFLIAGDIIHTVIKPTQEALVVLGAIVAIRTVISFFLNKELRAK
jgi:uncharacterized membrane protein